MWNLSACGLPRKKRKKKKVVISSDSVDRRRDMEMALRPRIDGKFRSIKFVSPSNENAPLPQNE
jgi:hypothetical protein